MALEAFYLPITLDEEVRRIAYQTDRSFGDVVREAVATHIPKLLAARAAG